MKCPKCGFNSFEFYDTCKKCSNDLKEYKQTHSITSIVLPYEAKTKLIVEQYSLAEGSAEHASDATEAHDDIFSFNMPEASLPKPDHQNNEPFYFNESSNGKNQSNNSKSEDNIFGDLLESTSQIEESPFADVMEAGGCATVEKIGDAASSLGEFDPESFSWDNTLVADGNEAEKDDGFDALFGETKVSAEK